MAGGVQHLQPDPVHLHRVPLPVGGDIPEGAHSGKGFAEQACGIPPAQVGGVAVDGQVRPLLPQAGYAQDVVEVAVGEQDGLRLQPLVHQPPGYLLPLVSRVHHAAFVPALPAENVTVGADLPQPQYADLHQTTPILFALSYDILARL